MADDREFEPRLGRIRATRTIDELCQAIGDICGLFQPDECRNYSNAA